MRTVYVLAIVAVVWLLASLLRIDPDSTVGLILFAWWLGLAVCRPRWLRLRYDTVGGDEASSRDAAAAMVGIAAVVFGALVGWRLTAIHRARASCTKTLAAAVPGHDRALALQRKVSIPLSGALSCTVLLSY